MVFERAVVRDTSPEGKGVPKAKERSPPLRRGAPGVSGVRDYPLRLNQLLKLNYSPGSDYQNNHCDREYRTDTNYSPDIGWSRRRLNG